LKLRLFSAGTVGDAILRTNRQPIVADSPRRVRLLRSVKHQPQVRREPAGES